MVSQSAWPGNGNWSFYYPGGIGPPQGVAVLTRPKNERGKLFYHSGYLGDVVTFGDATVSAGLRYDVQDGYNQGSSTSANPTIPDIRQRSRPKTNQRSSTGRPGSPASVQAMRWDPRRRP